MITFFYLYFISSVLLGSLWGYFLTQMDLWAINKWMELNVSEREWNIIKKSITIVLITPLSILILFWMIFILTKQKLGKK